MAELALEAADGRRRKKTYSGKTKKEVLAKLHEAQSNLRGGVAPTHDRLTVAEHLQQWLAGREQKVRGTTLHRYRSIAATHLIPELGRIRLNRLLPTDVDRLTSGMLKAGSSPQTAAHARSVLRAALAKAVKSGLLPRNVASLSESVRVDRHKIDGMAPEQAARIIAAVAEHALGALVRLALSTGARQGELLALRWQDVDFEDRTLKIERTYQRGTFTEPKTRRSRRTIELSDDDVRLLKEHRERQKVTSIGGLVFCRSNGQPLAGTSITREFQAHLKRAGLPSIRFHNLRHGNATILLAAGVPVHVVSERLGHADERITLTVYSHVIPKQRREAADVLAAVLRAAAV